MDFILPDQLHKYEDLLEGINQEYKKCEQLKRHLNKENDKIIIHNLSVSGINQKISHVGVKVFSDIFDLLALYDDELKVDAKQFLKYESHKFYLIELYLTQALLQKVSGMNCIINICINYDEMCINRSMKITSNLPSPILEIIPVDEIVVDCSVEAILITDQCMIIKLDSVLVDVSFHFKAYDKKRQPNLRETSILQVAKRYNEELALKELNETLVINYEFKFIMDIRTFIEILLKNSYHYLSSDLFTELISSDKNDFTLTLSLGVNKCEILYNKNDKICLRTTVSDLLMLKKYFYRMIQGSGENDKKLLSIKELKNSLPSNVQDTRQYYNSLRKCWSSLLML
ncbi:unnamed protein product [Phaedon cochleariae]|uniref:Uncharacterized protein n=1 Tax=Phaedon cochleariae TaxID=80249 RepID=A0A9P0GQK7_PHACE|nr:unnamed protein product [Phaedon cochleariae]